MFEKNKNIIIQLQQKKSRIIKWMCTNSPTAHATSVTERAVRTCTNGLNNLEPMHLITPKNRQRGPKAIILYRNSALNEATQNTDILSLNNRITTQSHMMQIVSWWARQYRQSGRFWRCINSGNFGIGMIYLE